MSGIRLFVGLGNPSDNYQNTRHNIGFNILDEIGNDIYVGSESL